MKCSPAQWGELVGAQLKSFISLFYWLGFTEWYTPGEVRRAVIHAGNECLIGKKMFKILSIFIINNSPVS